MKFDISFSLKTLFACAIILMQAQDKNAIATAKFGVSGNCELYKKTIQCPLNVEGMKPAVWDAKKQCISIVYQRSKIEEAKSHESMAASSNDMVLKDATVSSLTALTDGLQHTK